MRSSPWSWLFVLLGLLPLPALAENSTPLQVVTLHPLLGELAGRIGGDQVTVFDLLERGEDPHLFQPRPEDMQKASRADLVLAVGLGLEPYLDQLRQGASADASWLIIGDQLPDPLSGHTCTAHDHADHAHHDHGEFDPHWWHSIGNMELAAEMVRARLTEIAPAHAREFRDRTDGYLDQLTALKNWAALQIEKIPPDRRILVTSHLAFGYFARDYGFTVLPLAGTSTTEQPSSQAVRELIETMKSHRVRAVFAEDRENPRVLEQILQETGARNAGILYADGPGDDQATTYEEMMRHNISTLAEALP